MEVVTIPWFFKMSILYFINQEAVLPPMPFLSAQFNGFQYIHTYVQPSPWPILKHFHHLRKKRLPLAVTTTILSVSVDLSILDVSYKWNHTCGLLSLVSLTQYGVFKVHPRGMCQYFIPFIAT